MSKTEEKPFDSLDHQYNPAENSQQFDAKLIFTMGDKPLDLVACKKKQRRSVTYFQSSFLGVVVGRFLGPHVSPNNDSCVSVSRI